MGTVGEDYGSGDAAAVEVLFALFGEARLRRILARMLDEEEFLGPTEYARRHGGTPSTGLTRTIDPHHFYPTIESAIAGFRQQTHAEWTAARPDHR